MLREGGGGDVSDGGGQCGLDYVRCCGWGGGGRGGVGAYTKKSPGAALLSLTQMRICR
jgi:hypothetical protein